MGDSAKLRRMVKVSHQFICPITQEIMRNPVIAEDGHTYEKDAIENWLEKSPTSPMTRQQISSEKLIPNLALKQLIDQWKDEQRRSKGKAKVANDEAQSPPVSSAAGPTGSPCQKADDEEDENENWRLVDEEELQAALERSVAEPGLAVARRQQQAAKAKERALARSSGVAAGGGDDGGDPSEETWGTGGWLAFAGAVAVVAGGVAWAASSASSSSSSAGDVKRKVRVDEENTCIVS